MIIDLVWNVGGLFIFGIDFLGVVIEDCIIDYVFIDIVYIWEFWEIVDIFYMVWVIEDLSGVYLDMVSYFINYGMGMYWF